MKFLLLGLLSFHAALTAAIDPSVTVRNGTYEGLHLPAYNQDVFLGIPYAQDASGHNRFRVPQALDERWDGLKPAKTYSHACPDADPSDALYGMSENCLSLNVVRPAGLNDSSSLLPVMVWIHGGSYQVGTTGMSAYNMTYIVQRSIEINKPIIGVSINYRKGGWGFMYSIEIQGSGNANLGLRDMRQALAWISENIGAFGGDKNSVTIWGESSGSFAVGQLVLSYGGRHSNLFHRSIQESGSATTAWYNGTDWYQPIYNKILSQVNCTDAIDTLTCLRTIPYKTLYPFMNSSAVTGPGFYPTVDGDIIPNFPSILLEQGRFAHIPHLLGTNSDEGTANAPQGVINTDEDLQNYLYNDTGFDFPLATIDEIMHLYPDDPIKGIPLNTGTERFAAQGWQYKRIAAILGDVFYHGPRRFDARHYAKHDATYVYRFNTRPYDNTSTNSLEAAYLGVRHAGELPFVFANPDSLGPWPGYDDLSDTMTAMWINFAHSGDPNGAGVPAWSRYNEVGMGRNLVFQTTAQGGIHLEDDTYRLAGREFLTEWARRRHV
ncbi:carboxyesterase [Aspergillus californicus]